LTAVACSVLAHACLLAVHFAAPNAFHIKPADPGLEVILVNAKREHPPVSADALAQANLDGGGDADAGRAASPLPDMQMVENGDGIKSVQRRITELEQVARNVLAQTTRAQQHAPVSQVERPAPDPNGADEAETQKTIARKTAEIAERLSDQNRRPRHTYIFPATREAGYAMYYKGMQKRVEEIGTLDFPKSGGRKLYGSVMLSIPVFQDGTIYEKDGGPKVEASSGNPELDRAALAIARRSAPFGKFPATMRSPSGDDVWIVITTFIFSHDEKLHTDLRTRGNIEP
jgi:protein TonB